MPLPRVGNSNSVQPGRGRTGQVLTVCEGLQPCPNPNGPPGFVPAACEGLEGEDSVSAMQRGPFCTGEGFPVFPSTFWKSTQFKLPAYWSVFTLKRLFRLREADGRCEGISTMHLCCPMPGRACLKLQHCKMVRPCQSMWLFHLHSTAKIQPFSPVFPLAGSKPKAFGRLFLWNSKEKKHQPFSMAQPILKFICSRACRQLDTIY